MKNFLILICAGLAVSGCASSRVTMAPGENGSIATLDPKSGEVVTVIDQAGSVTRLRGAKAQIKAIEANEFERRYAELLASMPKEPRRFTLYFSEGSTEPTPESKSDLPSIFDEIKSRPGADLQVTGHTDTVGSFEVNDSVSLRRAAEITSWLFTLGLDKTIVRLAGRGERELKEQTPDETPSAVNRRVEVLVR